MSERPGRAKRVYGSQFGIAEDEVPGALTEMFGARMAEEALYSMGGSAWDDALSWKERSLAVIAVLIALGGVEDRLRTHIHWAIQNGATRQELDALVSMLTVYVGYPRAVAGMKVLIEELGPLDSEQ
jgi:alkylhydroperoxidase/carboxymuconolactone decarboxylase family protein YurZ